ncbi:MAG: UDP-N-acetylmuramoyl-tripeptide--D-alanyl-D-alanine ligase [Planctomycetota bacterium]
MDPLTLKQAALDLGADILDAEHTGRTCNGAAIDTRTLQPGQLFFALEGDNTDGHRYLEQARVAGAAAAVVRRGAELPEIGGPLPLLVTDDPRRALGRLATAHRRRLHATVVAITGSNGKTTTKEMVAAVLARRGKTVRSERSYNNDLGVPLSILRADSSTEYLVLEVGTNHPGEIAVLAELAQPQIAVITNIGEAHLGHFGSLKAIAKEKAALFEALPPEGVAVVHADDEFSDYLEAHAPGPVCRFGRLESPQEDAPLDIWAAGVRRSAHPRGVVFHLYGKMEFLVPVQGLHNVQNALAAVSVGMLLGCEPADVRDALREVVAPRMRLNREPVGGVTILDDSYNANPASMEAAMDELAATVTDGRRVLVVGDMAELGDMAQAQHERVGKRAAGFADILWAVGEHGRYIADAARRSGLPDDCVIWSASVELALEGPAFLPSPGDVMLFKASRSVELDRLAEALRQRLAADARAREAV